MKIALIFPANKDFIVFDRELKKEYDIVCDLGLFDVYTFDDYLWYDSKLLNFNKEPNESVKCIFRGYMMKAGEYKLFYNEMKSHNFDLITTPDEYSRLHIFPNIYENIKNDTAKSLFYSIEDKISIADIKKCFDNFVIKDYVKSVKDKEFPKCISSNISQEEFDSYISKFKEYRGNLLTGGICIKEFLKLKYYNGKINEFRVFYLDGNVMSVSRNSNQDTFTNEPPNTLIEKYSKLPSPYYTVDYVELDDGTFKIMEVGDGQVSGLSPMQDIGTYYRNIYNSLR